MNINWVESIKLNNMDEDNLKGYFKQYPKSHKRVIAICEICGNERNIAYQQYRSLCLKCSHNTLECINAKRLRGIEQFADPKVCKALSEQLIQYYIDNPESRKKAHINNPNSWDFANERQRGGYDMLDHHIIYDHADPTKHIMRMTRAMHSRLHRIFEAKGIGIPHINVRPDNIDIFKGRKKLSIL